MRAWRMAGFVALATLVLAVAGCGGKDEDKKKEGSSGQGIQVIDQQPRTAEVIGTAPDFKLTNQDGKEVSSEELKGKVVLYDFVYTNCKTICPTESALFARIRDELKKEGLLGDKAMLVTITFDPERDTPAVMKEYGQKYGADPANWPWLTGTQADIDRVVRDGFGIFYEKRLPAPQVEATDASGGHEHKSDEPPPPPGYDLDHMSIIVLVDKEGKSRAVYPASGFAPADFVKDIKDLL